MQLAGVKPSAVTHGILIKAYGQSNQIDNAFSVFKRMKESNLVPNSVTYGCLLDACVKNNKIDRAIEVFTTMQIDSVPLNTIIYTTMIKGFAKCFNLEGALDIYYKMKKDFALSGESHIRPNNVTFNSLLDCCVRCNHIEKAKEIFI
jgi:pentatricopeptide repeat protein